MWSDDDLEARDQKLQVAGPASARPNLASRLQKMLVSILYMLRLEEPMMLSFDSFERVLDNSPAAITVFTPEQKISWASSAHGTLFGRNPAELVGRSCMDLVHSADRNFFDRAREDVLVNPSERVTWDSTVTTASGGSRSVENTLSVLPGFGCVLYQHDVSARTEAARQQDQSAIDFTSAYVRLEEFAYSAAHDLREPLRAIATCTDLLVRGANVDFESKQKGEFISSGVARMSALIEDMLSFAISGIQQSSSPVDLKAAVAQAAEDLEPEMARTGAQVVVGPLPTAPGNKAQFVRIFQNLMSNAIKYGSDVPVRIEITAEVAGSEWVVAVKDNGCGIALEHQVEIFEPFKRLHSNGAPGSGLGLALTKRIVEGWGGTIWVQSDLASGSTFSFSIPIAAEQAAKSKTQAA